MLICSIRLTKARESNVPSVVMSYEALLHKLHTTDSLAETVIFFFHMMDKRMRGT